MKSSLLLIVLAALASFVRAAAPATPVEPAPAVATGPLTRDLGRNLLYHRVRALPADFPAGTRKQPCVLDVRYLHASNDDTEALHAWIKSHATPRTPLFILANADTDRDLVAPFMGRSATGSVVLIGAAARGFSPDIAVQISAADERLAYDALEAGVELSALLTENPNKVRNDEASLSRDRASTPPSPSSETSGATASPPPPIDAALQRAVHLHRTLVALRKI